MKVYCAWCLREGKRTLVSEKPDCDSKGDSFGGICFKHHAELMEKARNLKKGGESK